VTTSTRLGLIEDIVISIVVFLVVSLRNTDGAVFQGANSSTEQSQRNEAYYGGNFTLGNAFNLGGMLSFLGYLAVLFVSLWYAIASLFRKGLSLDQQAAVVSIIVLMPFIIQRTVVWDSSFFALMCAPFVIGYLRRALK
jgi:hypothetical protein